MMQSVLFRHRPLTRRSPRSSAGRLEVGEEDVLVEGDDDVLVEGDEEDGWVDAASLVVL